MTNPIVPSKLLGVTHADVFLGKLGIVGSGSVILHGVTLGKGVHVRALQLVHKSCQAFRVYAANPARRINECKRDLREWEQKLITSMSR